MTSTKAQVPGARAFRATAAAAVMGLMVLLVAGCAVQPEESSSANITDSAEEPEHRRRARIRLELATGYFEQGKTEIALEELKQVIAADPNYPDAYNLRGLILMRLNDTRGADESFRRALALNPRDSDALHNHGWLQCQTGRYDEAVRAFEQAMANPLYAGRSKTLMAQGVCHARAGRIEEAERSLSRAYELDAANPITGYNLASLLYRRGEFQRAQFYIRRLNNSELANAESLWLGVKVERRMNDRAAMLQLGEQLRKRFPQSRERAAYDRGAFDE